MSTVIKFESIIPSPKELTVQHRVCTWESKVEMVDHPAVIVIENGTATDQAGAIGEDTDRDHDPEIDENIDIDLHPHIAVDHHHHTNESVDPDHKNPEQPPRWAKILFSGIQPKVDVCYFSAT